MNYRRRKAIRVAIEIEYRNAISDFRIAFAHRSTEAEPRRIARDLVRKLRILYPNLCDAIKHESEAYWGTI